MVSNAILSTGQELLCYIENLAPGRVSGPRAVSLAAYQLPGPVDVGALGAAVADLPGRHEALRTVLSYAPPAAAVTPAANGASSARLTVLGPVPDLAAMLGAATDPAPVQALLGTYPDGVTVLLLVARMAVADPWSTQLLMRDLAACYTARLNGDPPPPSGRSAAPPRPDERRVEAALPYWTSVLADPPALPLPSGPGPATHRFTVDTVDAKTLARSARAARATPFLVLLTAFATALAIETGATDLAIPVLTYGRERADWDTVGFFMNALVVRVGVDPDRPAGETLGRVRTAFFTACANELPLATLIRRLPAAARLFSPTGVRSAQFELIQLPDEPAEPGRYRRLPIPGQAAPDTALLPFNGLLCTFEPEPDGRLNGTLYTNGDVPAELLSRLASRVSSVLAEQP